MVGGRGWGHREYRKGLLRVLIRVTDNLDGETAALNLVSLFGRQEGLSGVWIGVSGVLDRSVG